MAFADCLRRLEATLEEPQRGIPSTKRLVSVDDLRELVRQFYKSDEALRGLAMMHDAQRHVRK